jgi:hypothetical protein
MSATPTTPDSTYLNPATQDESTIPSFISKAVDPSSVQQVYSPRSQQGAPDVAGEQTIAESTPGKISVFNPSQYTPAVRDHEMTHQFQQTRSDGTIPLPGGNKLPVFGQHPTAAPEQYETGDPRNYSYGGEGALMDAQADGKSIGDFNIEQQADMVKDYQAKQNAYLAKANAGTLTPEDQNAMHQSYRAYHPLVQQLSAQPKSFSDSLPPLKTMLGIGKPAPLAPAPAAPGLPYGVAGLGVTPTDPLLSGKPVAIPTGNRSKR